MQYLVFGVLLILGAVVIGLFLYLSHVKNKVEAIVLESYCDIKQKGQEIENITVTHLLEFELDGEKKKIETDMFPVRELGGAKFFLHYDKGNERVFIPDFERYYPFLAAFFLSGVFCLVLYFLELNEWDFLQLLSQSEWLALLFGGIAVVSFSHVTMIINPAVLKTKGNFEGVLMSEDEGNEVEVYSLWYGEHRQYAKRTRGMALKQNPEKTVTLFYNTKTGTVCRLHEFGISMCVSAAAFLAMIVVLLIA